MTLNSSTKCGTSARSWCAYTEVYAEVDDREWGEDEEGLAEGETEERRGEEHVDPTPRHPWGEMMRRERE